MSKKKWKRVRRLTVDNNWQLAGVLIGAIGLGLLAYQVALLCCAESRDDTQLLGPALGIGSVGLALLAIGISREADKRYTSILGRIDENVRALVVDPVVDTVDSSTQPLSTDMVGAVGVETSEEAARKRLDRDTKKVGFQRGEVRQLEDGTWGIAWGGKYRL